jgi:hypothetical protein
LMRDERVVMRDQIGIRDASDADLPSTVEIVNREIAESPFVWGEVANTMSERRSEVFLIKHLDSSA